MRNRLLAVGITLAAMLPMWVSPAAAVDVLRVGGTGGATALLERLGQPFTQHSGIAVEVIPSLGSTGGLSAAIDGVLDIAVSGRVPSAAETASGLVTALMVRTPYVLATSHPRPPAMTAHEVVQTYASEEATWPDGSRIKLILRPRSDSGTATLAALFPGMDAALKQASRRSDLPVAGTDQDSAELAEKLPGSLISTTYTQVTLEHRNLRLIALDGVSPTMEAFEGGAYRHAATFHVVHPRQPSPAAKLFVDFLTSTEGLRALRAAGCLPGIE